MPYAMQDALAPVLLYLAIGATYLLAGPAFTLKLLGVPDKANPFAALAIAGVSRASGLHDWS